MDGHLAALSEGIVAPHGRELARMSWLEFALNPLPDLFAVAARRRECQGEGRVAQEGDSPIARSASRTII